MSFNLTPNQKDLARSLATHTRSGHLPESFYVVEGDGVLAIFDFKDPDYLKVNLPGTLGSLDALAEAKMLIQRINYETLIFWFITKSLFWTEEKLGRCPRPRPTPTSLAYVSFAVSPK